MDQVKIGNFIAELRRENNMTQEFLGQKIGVTNKTISRWENGCYMPNIEMLQLLSSEFNVSLNELLCGKRLNDSNFKQESDNNLVDVIKSGNFSNKERIAFWKKKWMREHITLIIFCSIFAIVAYLGFWIASVYWIMAICPIGWLVLYAILRNSMMIYIENKIYEVPSECIKFK